MKPKLPRCEACKSQPRSLGHWESASHKVKQFAFDQRQRGLERAKQGYAVIQQIDSKLLTRGPASSSSWNHSTKKVEFTECFWAPIWATRIANALDVRVDLRRSWLRTLYESPELQAAFLAHLALEGEVHRFFIDRELLVKDLSPAGRDQFFSKLQSERLKQP